MLTSIFWLLVFLKSSVPIIFLSYSKCKWTLHLHSENFIAYFSYHMVRGNRSSSIYQSVIVYIYLIYIAFYTYGKGQEYFLFFCRVTLGLPVRVPFVITLIIDVRTVHISTTIRTFLSFDKSSLTLILNFYHIEKSNISTALL